MRESEILTKRCVLQVNRYYQAIFEKTPAEAIGMMMSDAATGLDIYSLEEMNPVPWEVWKGLPIRDGDDFINTAHAKIRIPKVIIAVNYEICKGKKPKFSSRNVKARDHFTCQYCGRIFSEDELNMDHVIPRDQDGPTSWDNIVASCFNCNSEKANRTPEEAGLKLLKKPIEPGYLPPSCFISNRYQIPEWNPFLYKG